MTFGPDVPISRVGPWWDFSPLSATYRANVALRQQRFPFLLGVRASIRLNAFRANDGSLVPAIHTAIPAVESRSSALGTGGHLCDLTDKITGAA